MEYDLVVIGAGPAGEVGAIRAAQLGMKVALVEKNSHLGGTCLNVGCIPTKCLIESAKTYSVLKKSEQLGFILSSYKFDWAKIQARKDGIVDAQRKGLRFLMKKNKIDVYEGKASFATSQMIKVALNDGKTAELKTKRTLLATGSRVKELGFAKSNGKNILTSDSILAIKEVPKSIAIVGGGVVGMEFASLFGRFGSEVVVIEAAKQVLPFEDKESVDTLVLHLQKQNVKVEVDAKLTAVEDQGDHCVVKVSGKEDRKFAKVLMSIGREPVLDGLGLENTKVKIDKGRAVIDAHYQTTDPNIWAVGDVITTPALAHTASAEAKHAVEMMAGHHLAPINYEANPSAIYTYPEIASIGYTEAQLKEKSIEYKVAKFPFAPMAKAKIEDATEGFIKVLYHPHYQEILGAHIVGAKATELIAEFSLAKNVEATLSEIGLTIHPHPTISETAMEAAHIAEGGAIHL